MMDCPHCGSTSHRYASFLAVGEVPSDIFPPVGAIGYCCECYGVVRRLPQSVEAVKADELGQDHKLVQALLEGTLGPARRARAEEPAPPPYVTCVVCKTALKVNVTCRCGQVHRLRAGMFNVCGRCSNVAIFDETLQLRALTPQEEEVALADPTTKRMQDLVMRIRRGGHA